MKTLPFQMEDDVYQLMMQGFIREHPIPEVLVLDEDGNPTLDANGEPITTPKYTED